MCMKILLRQSQFNTLLEQDLDLGSKLMSIGTSGISKLSKDIYDKYEMFSTFVDDIRPRIEEMGKKLYPANDMVAKDPKLKTTPQYRDLKDKEDAYDHQLASAMAASMFGPSFSDIIGKANEIKGGLRMFFKGSPSKGVGKFEQFTSGWDEDNANNQIGIEIAKKFPNKDLQFYSNEVVKNINQKNYYDSTGKKKS